MIAVIGEALIDLIVDGTGTHRAVPGGSPANVAVTLARLGTPARLLARLSTDEYGAQIRSYLADNGVDLGQAVTAREPTSLAIATFDARRQATYDFRMEDTADWQWTDAELPAVFDPSVLAVHSGSLALGIQPGAAAIERLLRRERDLSRVTVSIDLNLRPSIMSDMEAERRRVERQISLAHIVKASEEDLAWLYPGIPPSNIVADWHAAGVACAVVTHGADGAYLMAPNGIAYRRHAPRVDVVDTVGAGDAFTGAMLAALADLGALGSGPVGRLADLPPRHWLAVLEHATTVAAITCTRAGANPPTRAEMLTTV